MKKLFYFLVMLGLLNFPIQTKAAESTHIVISEIKTSGGSGKSTDEFIELYNPTEAEVNLDGWGLLKKTASGSDYILVDNFGEKTIPAHSFFLIAHPAGYLGEVTPNFYYTTTNSISDNNTVILLDPKQTIIDEVGYGTATVFETEVAVNPPGGKSLERKARSDSSLELMVEGGAHYYLGNGEDSNNNKTDFIIRDAPEPQNLDAEQEYLDIAIPELPKQQAVEPIGQLFSGKETKNAKKIVYSDKIIITEIFPNPQGSDDGEFIELLNTGDKSVDLDGWKVGDTSSRLFTISSKDFSSTLITAQGYFVIEKKISGISLNNTGDAAKLYQPDGTLVVSIEYGDCQEGKSYSYVDGKWGWSDDITPGYPNTLTIHNEPPIAFFVVEPDNPKVGDEIFFDASGSQDADDDELVYVWDFGDGQKAEGKKTGHRFQKQGKYVVRLTITDGKGGEDEIESKVEIIDYDYSDFLIINELLPACQGAGEDCEYIELYNPENRVIKLDGWRLNIKKSNYVFPESAAIKARSFLVVKREESRLSLSNRGATVYLLDPRGKIINGVEYGQAKDELSFSRVDSRQWQWTEKQTPGAANEIMALEGAEEEKDNESGTTTEKKTASNNTPLAMDISEIDETFLGQILKVRGELESKRGLSYYLMDKSGNVIRVYIQTKTNIPKPEVGVGDQMEVVGVLDKTSAGLRLLPRTAADIVIIPKNVATQPMEGQVLGATTTKEIMDVPITNRSSQVRMYLITGLASLVFITMVFVYRKFFKKSE